MNTHLSEASVNSLLSLVKGANTSGSYDDKINILTKAGVLHGGQKYSSRVESLYPDPDYTVMVPVQVGDAVDPATGYASISVTGTLQVRAADAYGHLNNFKTLATAALPLFHDAPDEFRSGLTAVVAGQAFAVPLPVFDALSAAARELDFKAAGRVYTNLLAQVRSTGLVGNLATLVTYQSDALDDLKMLPEIVKLLLELGELGLPIEDIINEGPAYLSTIPDGTYSFTVNQANTTQPVILTGTAVITSQYDRYTKRLEQKLINNTIVGAPPITALQTLDASYNSIQVDTSGSSYNGKYTVTGNTATITSNGYSKAAGAFVETVTTIISSIFSVYVINSIINPDKSQTTISLTIYTRQLTSAEVSKAIGEGFDEADTDGDGGLRPDEALLAAYRLAGSLGGRVILDLDQLEQWIGPISKEVFVRAFPRRLEVFPSDKP